MLLNKCVFNLIKKRIFKINKMKLNLKKIYFIYRWILMGGTLFAQTADTANVSNDYVKPFSGDGAFRTWSIGVSGGILTPLHYF